MRILGLTGVGIPPILQSAHLEFIKKKVVSIYSWKIYRLGSQLLPFAQLDKKKDKIRDGKERFEG